MSSRFFFFSRWFRSLQVLFFSILKDTGTCIFSRRLKKIKKLVQLATTRSFVNLFRIIVLFFIKKKKVLFLKKSMDGLVPVLFLLIYVTDESLHEFPTPKQQSFSKDERVRPLVKNIICKRILIVMSIIYSISRINYTPDYSL